MRATSSFAGRADGGGTGACFSNADHGVVPGAGLESAERDSRAFSIGSLRRSRLASGIASIMVTLMMWCGRTEAGRFWTRLAAASHTIATSAR